MPKIARNIPDQELLPLFSGKTTELTLSSGRVVKIRETNGDDDELISSLNNSVNGDNIYNFLSSIVLHDSFLDGKPTPRDVKRWHINDKYGLLFKQRLFIHGDVLKFKSICTEENCGKEYEYTEDLSKWDDDLTKEADPNKSFAIKRYPLGDLQEVEFTISSGKKLKYSILNGELEEIALELKDMTKNSPLIIRKLMIENKGEWIGVKHFGGFSSKEMLEIRSHIKANDIQFDPIVNFTCNNPKCQKAYSVSLFSIGTFLFPEEMI